MVKNKLEDQFRYGPFKTKNVLLVDDEGDLGWIMKKVMHKAGHRFIYARSFREGLGKFKRSKNLDVAIVDLRLIDTNVYDESGLKFIKEAKRINNQVTFIMISAFGTEEVKEKAKTLGVKVFLDKPLKSEKLLGIINH